MPLSSLLLKLLGWKVETEEDVTKYKKAVLIMAPHTSIYDFIIGWLALKKLNVKAKFLIKKEFFFFPLSIILKSLGAIPVDRGDPKNLPRYLVKLINKLSEMWLIITPEGTRKPVKNWKRGFYYIADSAQIPIIPSYLDYQKKIAHVLPAFYPTGNYYSDIQPFIDILANVNARNKNNFVLPKN